MVVAPRIHSGPVHRWGPWGGRHQQHLQRWPGKGSQGWLKGGVCGEEGGVGGSGPQEAAASFQLTAFKTQWSHSIAKQLAIRPWWWHPHIHSGRRALLGAMGWTTSAASTALT